MNYDKNKKSRCNVLSEKEKSPESIKTPQKSKITQKIKTLKTPQKIKTPKKPLKLIKKTSNRAQKKSKSFKNKSIYIQTNQTKLVKTRHQPVRKCKYSKKKGTFDLRPPLEFTDQHAVIQM